MIQRTHHSWTVTETLGAAGRLLVEGLIRTGLAEVAYGETAEPVRAVDSWLAERWAAPAAVSAP